MAFDPTTIVTSLVSSLGVAGIIALVAGALKSPQAKAAAEAAAAKTTAEIRHLVARTDAQNNALLHTLVYSLMHYAEQHGDDLVANGVHKADFVLTNIQKDPRFPGMGVGLAAVQAIIEEYFHDVFQYLAKSEPAAAPAPAQAAA